MSIELDVNSFVSSLKMAYDAADEVPYYIYTDGEAYIYNEIIKGFVAITSYVSVRTASVTTCRALNITCGSIKEFPLTVICSTISRVIPCHITFIPDAAVCCI